MTSLPRETTAYIDMAGSTDLRAKERGLGGLDQRLGEAWHKLVSHLDRWISRSKCQITLLALFTMASRCL